jgi:hypothetical protein
MGPLDILSLRALVSATQQNDDRCAVLHIVHAIARSIVDPHFHDALTDAPGVSRISPLHTTDAGDDPRNGIVVLQATQPVRKFRGLAHLDQQIVV